MSELSTFRGNAAAMRDALLMVKRLFDGRIMFQPAIREAHKAVEAALSAPPRNCDVGMAEEQLKRFKDFCRIISKDETCDGCPLLPQCSTLEHCTLKWAQMTYEE
jgi:hypothetical protein